MSTVEPGAAAAGQTAAGEDGEITKRPDGKYAYTVGEGSDSVVIIGNSEEEIQSWLNWASMNKEKPISELTEADMKGSMTVGGYDLVDPTGDVIRLNATGTNYIDTYASEGYITPGNAFYGDIPAYPEGSNTNIYFTSSANSDWATHLAALSGTAKYFYEANYADSNAKPINLQNQDAETVKLLEMMFGKGTAFTTDHLDTLRLMGLVTGSPNKGFKPSETGNQLLSSPVKDQAGAYIPSMGLLGLGEELITKANGVSSYFENGAFKAGFSTQTVEDDAKAIHEGMAPAEGEELPKVAPYDESREMMNLLFGKDPSNATFTAEEINTAVAMGLVTYNPNLQVFNTTANGNTYLAAKNAEAAAAAAPPPPPPTGNYGTEEAYNNYANGLGIPKFGDDDNFEGDRYKTRQELLSRGFPPEVVEWIFKHFAGKDGVVSEITLDALIEKGYLTHVNRDKHGRGADRYALTAAGVELVAADPTLFPDPEARKQFFITSMGIATYAGEVVAGNVKVHERDFWGKAMEYANDPNIRPTFEDEWAAFVAARP